MKSPDEEVATRIIEQLRKQGILSDVTLRKLEPIIAAGKLSAEDWKLVVEFNRREAKKVSESEGR